MRVIALGVPWAAQSVASSGQASAAQSAQSRGCSVFPTVIPAAAVVDITTDITASIVIGESTALIPDSRPCRIRNVGAGQFFSRYPVRKIHQITTRQITRNASVMPTLTAMLTSAIS